MALTHAHLATLLLSVCVVKLFLVHSFCFAILLPLSFLESSQHPLFHTYAHGGCGVRLRHVGCVLIRGGHSVTGAGERGDEGVISSLDDR